MARPIPEIRARLHVLADEHGIPELHDLAEETKRRFFGRKARPKQKLITQSVIDGVRDLYRRNPDMHQRDIARWFGIDGGRVNEILHGFRDGSSYESRHPPQ